MRIKVCGITNETDAAMVSGAGADAIGMVFYPASPRHVSDFGLARSIVQAVNPFVSVVALVVNPEQAWLESLLAQVPINVLQFHGGESPSFCEQFERPYLKAIRMKAGVDINSEVAAYSSSAGILLDTYKKGIPGGTGEVFSWDLVPSVRTRPIILAGGLNAENVAEAIRTARPDAVDVSGGVELAPGKKCPHKVKQFIAEAKGY